MLLLIDQYYIQCALCHILVSQVKLLFPEYVVLVHMCTVPSKLNVKFSQSISYFELKKMP